MAQAYIQYKNRGFWIQESFIEVLSYYVCLTFEGNGVNNLSNDVKKIYSEFSDNKSGEKIGVVDIPFERYIDSSIDINYIKGIFEQT